MILICISLSISNTDRNSQTNLSLNNLASPIQQKLSQLFHVYFFLPQESYIITIRFVLHHVKLHCLSDMGMGVPAGRLLNTVYANTVLLVSSGIFLDKELDIVLQINFHLKLQTDTV